MAQPAGESTRLNVAQKVSRGAADESPPSRVSASCAFARLEWSTGLEGVAVTGENGGGDAAPRRNRVNSVAFREAAKNRDLRA